LAKLHIYYRYNDLDKVFVPIENIQTLVSTSPEVAAYMTKIGHKSFALIQPLWVFLLIWMFLSSEVFVNEKIDGRLEMLLTTPLN
jgi:ABC-type Na+ efflux pump permease subunit